MKRRISIVVAASALAGCTVGPNYQRPAVAVPGAFRAAEPIPATQAASLATVKWFEVFKDDKLQELIRTALQQNYDLRDAVARVEAARAELGITRSNQYPNFSATGEVQFNRLSRNGTTDLGPLILSSQNRTFGQAALNLLSFEIDIWGRLRRATEAARANLLSEEENQKAVITTLVSDVATAYLTMRELDYELEISQRTLQTRQESLELTKSRQRGGVSTLLDLRQAEQLVDTAAQTIPGIQQNIEQTENAIRRRLIVARYGGLAAGMASMRIANPR
jgi:multidrug efflux system outer membrane protein